MRTPCGSRVRSPTSERKCSGQTKNAQRKNMLRLCGRGHDPNTSRAHWHLVTQTHNDRSIHLLHETALARVGVLKSCHPWHDFTPVGPGRTLTVHWSFWEGGGGWLNKHNPEPCALHRCESNDNITQSHGSGIALPRTTTATGTAPSCGSTPSGDDTKTNHHADRCVTTTDDGGSRR